MYWRRKKNVYIFYVSSSINEKKNIMKNEKKKLVQKIELGYCPDYIARKEIVSQYRYCIVTGNARLEGCLYCNTIFCIVT